VDDVFVTIPRRKPPPQFGLDQNNATTANATISPALQTARTAHALLDMRYHSAAVKKAAGSNAAAMTSKCEMQLNRPVSPKHGFSVGAIARSVIQTTKLKATIEADMKKAVATRERANGVKTPSSRATRECIAGVAARSAITLQVEC